MAIRSSESLAKGLRLLTAIVVDGGRSNLTVLARQAGIPVSTAYRLAATLEAEGFLSRHQGGRYSSRLRLEGQPEVEDPARRAAFLLREPLARFARLRQAIAHFGILEDGMVTYLVKEAGAPNELFTSEMKQLEAYCSAIGKVLLAALPDEELDAYLACGPFPALTRATITDPELIRREIAAVRVAKIAYDKKEVRDDLFCISVPVLDENGDTLGAISASFIDRSLAPKDIMSIKRSLRAISRLGYR